MCVNNNLMSTHQPKIMRVLSHKLVFLFFCFFIWTPSSVHCTFNKSCPFIYKVLSLTHIFTNGLPLKQLGSCSQQIESRLKMLGQTLCVLATVANWTIGCYKKKIGLYCKYCFSFNTNKHTNTKMSISWWIGGNGHPKIEVFECHNCLIQVMEGNIDAKS